MKKLRLTRESAQRIQIVITEHGDKCNIKIFGWIHIDLHNFRQLANIVIDKRFQDLLELEDNSRICATVYKDDVKRLRNQLFKLYKILQVFYDDVFVEDA